MIGRTRNHPRKTAFMLFGGSSRHHQCVGKNRLPVTHGGLSEVANWSGPILRENGFKRVLAKDIGGHWPLYWYDDQKPREHADAQEEAVERFGISAAGSWVIHFNQWLLAEQSGVSWANRQELSLYHNLLVQDYGIEEVIYYLGSPWRHWWEVQQASIEPFVHLEGASFCYDVVHELEHFERLRRLCRWIRKLNPTAKNYSESLPELEVKQSKHAQFFSGCFARIERGQARPDLLRNVEEWTDYELLTLVSPERETDLRETQTPLLRDWGQN